MTPLTSIFHEPTAERDGTPASYVGGCLSRTRFDSLAFIREFQILLGAGLNAVEAVHALRDESRAADAPRTAEVLDPVSRCLNEGMTLSEALARQNSFSPLLCASIKAVETTGNLLPALQRYVAYQERLRELKNRVVNALTYPVIVTVVGVGVLAFLLLYLVPRFADVYGDLRADLPIYSRLLFSAGAWLAANTLLITALLLAVAIAIFGFLSDRGLRSVVVEWLLRRRRIQAALMPYELSRLYRTLAMLVGSGVPLIQALILAEGVGSSFVTTRLVKARLALSEGQPMTHTLASQQLASPAAVGLLLAAERAGALGEVFQRIADYYDEVVHQRFDRFARWFEPLILLAVALGVGMVVVLLYMPIFELIGQIA